MKNMNKFSNEFCEVNGGKMKFFKATEKWSVGEVHLVEKWVMKNAAVSQQVSWLMQLDKTTGVIRNPEKNPKNTPQPRCRLRGGFNALLKRREQKWSSVLNEGG